MASNRVGVKTWLSFMVPLHRTNLSLTVKLQFVEVLPVSIKGKSSVGFYLESMRVLLQFLVNLGNSNR